MNTVNDSLMPSVGEEKLVTPHNCAGDGGRGSSEETGFVSTKSGVSKCFLDETEMATT